MRMDAREAVKEMIGSAQNDLEAANATQATVIWEDKDAATEMGQTAAARATGHQSGTHATTRSPVPVLAHSQFSDISQLWMNVAAFLSVSSLRRLACTSSVFRAVLPMCVTTSTAKQFLERDFFLRTMPGLKSGYLFVTSAANEHPEKVCLHL